MAAIDTLENFLQSLLGKEKDDLKELIRRLREDMYAARSEDARVRLVHDFIQEVRQPGKKK